MQRSRLSLEHVFFPSSFEADFETQFTTRPCALSCLCDSIMNRFLPESLFDESTLIDLKGHGDAGAEELLLVEGVLPPFENEEREESFSLRYTTAFRSFIGHKQISYDVHTERNGKVFEALSPRELGRSLPLQLRHLRLWVDFFEANFFGQWFGFSPTVRKTVRVDVLSEAAGVAVQISMHAEGLKTRIENPFELHEGLARLADMLRSATGEDLVPLYRQALRDSCG